MVLISFENYIKIKPDISLSVPVLIYYHVTSQENL